MESIPYLLAPNGLTESIVKGFNALKQKDDPAFVPLKGKWDISSRPELRADVHWARLVPMEAKGMSAWKARYVEIPLEMAPYVVVDEYDGSETYDIDYNKYGIKEIQKILANANEADTLSAIQAVLDKVTSWYHGA